MVRSPARSSTVLAAGDVLDGDVAGGNARVEFGVSRDADFDVEIIARAAGDVKFGAAGGTGEAGNEGRRFCFCSCRRY